MRGTDAAAAAGSRDSATADDDGPMTTSTPRATRSSNDGPAFPLSSSPASRLTTSTGAPSTPPAALISRTAAFTPATWPGLSTARPPLPGKRVPMRRMPSPVGDGRAVVGVGIGGPVQPVTAATTAAASTTESEARLRACDMTRG